MRLVLLVELKLPPSLVLILGSLGFYGLAAIQILHT